MSVNILLTGATGLIGGTVLHEILKTHFASSVFTVVRTDEQEAVIAKLGVHVLRFDLNDKEAVNKAVLSNDVGIVINTANSMDQTVALPFIDALGRRKKEFGKLGFYIHTSGATLFADRTGWRHGTVKDTDDVLSLFKSTEAPYIIRETDAAILESASQNDVPTYIIVPPLVYGRGTGEVNNMSAQIPEIIRTSIKEKVARKFADDGTWQAIHVTDLAKQYTAILATLPTAKPPPTGYFFASAHRVTWWEIVDHLATALHAKGLVTSPQAEIWASEAAAAEAIGIPELYIGTAFNSTTDSVFDKADQIDWKPEWNHQRFLDSLDDEIQAVIDAGPNVKTLISSFKSAK